MDSLKQTLDDAPSVTENGAVGFKTTGTKLLDINFTISSMRNMSEADIINKFMCAWYEDKLLALKWLFYARDIRGGIGERRLFRICFKHLAKSQPELIRPVIRLVSEYGRWDDILCLLDTPLKKDTLEIIREQLDTDMQNMQEKQPISLCAKWLPSYQKKSAQPIYKGLGITNKEYGKMLTKLRAYLKIVEIYMSKNQWDRINYAAVPSRANLRYNNAFLRHDEERRRAYLESLRQGETKINAGVLFPHDIVHQYSNPYGYPHELDVTLEELWKALPDFVCGNGNTICVADGSGSMRTSVGNGKVTCLEVANALAIYFSERSTGQFKDRYITFSERPQFVDFSKAETLREKIEIAKIHNEVANTNIEAVFYLILKTAINQHMSQEEMPSNILILSDMEFDSCVMVNGTNNQLSYYSFKQPDKKLFEVFAERYAKKGYKLPRLVFWNICSRSNTIPVKENDLGVALVSGFSPTIAKMVLSNKTDPFECLKEQLNSERYQPVEEAVKKYLN